MTKKYFIFFAVIVFLFSLVIAPTMLIAQNNDNNFNNQDDGNNGDSGDAGNDNDWDDWDDIDDDDLISSNNDNDTGNQDILSLIVNPLIIGGKVSLTLPIVVGYPPEDYETIFDNTMILGTPLNASMSLNFRPNDVIRGYFDLDLSYTPRYYDGLYTNQWVDAVFDIQLDELFLDINAGFVMFMRLGKQHIKYGSGYRWNPTDFINSQRKDPLEPETERAGITGIDISFPIQRFRISAFFGLESAKNILDTSIDLRLEFSYQLFRVTGSVYVKRGRVPMYGLDMFLGADFWGATWEFTAEMSFSMGSNKAFVAFDPAREGIDLSWFITHPNATQEEMMAYVYDHLKFYTYTNGKDPFFKIVGGLTITPNKLPDWLADMMIINIEYYYNGEGYDYPARDEQGNPINLIPYALMLGNFSEMGKHYGGISLIMSGPFTLEDVSFTVNCIINFTDASSLLFISIGYSGIDWLGFSGYLKFNFGKEGTEYYFASPMTVASFISHLFDLEGMTTGNFDIITQEITGYSGVIREIFTFGIKLEVKF